MVPATPPKMKRLSRRCSVRSLRWEASAVAPGGPLLASCLALCLLWELCLLTRFQ